MALANHDFVGTGWAFPPQTSPSGGIALVGRSQELEQAIRIILTTHPGERPMRPDFGCPLRDFVFRPADMSTASELSFAVRTAVMRWEPRVDVVDVLVHPDPDRRDRLDIEVVYSVKGENDRRNLVHPFYTIPDDGSEY